MPDMPVVLAPATPQSMQEVLWWHCVLLDVLAAGATANAQVVGKLSSLHVTSSSQHVNQHLCGTKHVAEAQVLAAAGMQIDDRCCHASRDSPSWREGSMGESR